MPNRWTTQDMVNTTLHLPRAWLDKIEELKIKGFIPNRSVFIRLCVYQELKDYFDVNYESLDRLSNNDYVKLKELGKI